MYFVEPVSKLIYANVHSQRGGAATCPNFGWVCALAEPKSTPITHAKFFIKNSPKAYKNDMNLLIFLNLTFITHAKISNFTVFKGKKVQIFLIFTYNQGKIFLILPITQGDTCIPDLHWELPPLDAQLFR